MDKLQIKLRICSARFTFRSTTQRMYGVKNFRLAYSYNAVKFSKNLSKTMAKTMAFTQTLSKTQALAQAKSVRSVSVALSVVLIGLLAFSQASAQSSVKSTAQSTSESTEQSTLLASQKTPSQLEKDNSIRSYLTDYAQTAAESYSATASQLRQLQSTVDRFLNNPSAAGLELLKTQWIAAKSFYMPTEVYRYFESPIDGEFGPEPFVNSWPLDEAYIDYVQGDANAGIINRPDIYPEITESLLLELNEKNGETNITTGFHAIEFLLWGQDLSVKTAGVRSFEDYVLGKTSNAARRRKYLKVAVELLARSIEKVRDDWKTDYKTEFLENSNSVATLKKTVAALVKLSGQEMAQERMFVAVDAQSQEDEHSCFSDTTWLDFQLDLKGIKNVLYGVKGRMGLLQLLSIYGQDVKAIESKVNEVEGLLKAIPQPFDQAILNVAGSQSILNAVKGLEDLSTLIESTSRAAQF